MNQTTLEHPIHAQGKGLHSGQRVDVSLFPAPADHGVVFVRTDLPTAPQVRVAQAAVSETTLCTGLSEGSVHRSQNSNALF